MKSWRDSRSPELPEVLPAPTAGSSLSAADAAIAAALLAVTLAVCIPVALHYRAEAKELDAERDAAARRSRSVRSTIQHLEARRITQSRMRRVVDRYVADVQAKPMVPWTTAMGELSRRKPVGVWTTRLSGDGPRFRAQVGAARPELVAAYTQSLRESTYVDFASGEAPAAGTAPGAHAQVVGRLMGE